jgi:DNA-binding NtrC family response regulator
MPRTPTILVVDDEHSARAYMETLLKVMGCHVRLSDGAADAIAHLRNGLSPDLILLDVNMPGMDGLEALQQIRIIAPSRKVVMASSVTDTKKVVRAIQLGALDYLTKPINREDLENALRNSISEKKGQTEPVEEATGLIRISKDNYFVCASPAMRKLRSQAALVASCDIPVLILGESGTGKEVIASLIHHTSSRSAHPLLKVNCAAVPSELLESELFGYEAGAFTGATKAKPGKFEMCNKGTILLDEIGEMAPALQAKLLHVLQDQEFSRLGARNTIKSDVRVIAATNVDIKEAMASKKLRPDLYYRLNGLTLRLPPLRERHEEIPILIRHFMTQLTEKFARPAPPVSPRLIQACLAYQWPGNIRELQNFVKRYCLLGDEDLAVSELTGEIKSSDLAPDAVVKLGKLKSLVRGLKNGAEAIAIAEALQQTNWRRKQAADLLGISYKALLYKMRQFEIQPPAASE